MNIFNPTLEDIVSFIETYIHSYKRSSTFSYHWLETIEEAYALGLLEIDDDYIVSSYKMEISGTFRKSDTFKDMADFSRI